MAQVKQKIYLDYAATTPADKEVLNAMMPYFSDKFGNASSVHSFGQEAIAAIDRSRETIAKLLNCDFSEIIFTGSATESNNLAIKGLVNNFKKAHIITTNIEHESILEPIEELKKSGHETTYLKVNKDGFIKISDLEKTVKNNTVLVSVIYASNEIGTIQPVKEIGKYLQKINDKRKAAGLGRIYFHTDAVQAFNYLECRPDWLKVDLLTFSGHKIYGPKGVGALYIRNGTPISQIITGGGQEFGLRSSTENTPYIVGLAKAVELVFENREKHFKHILNLRNQLLNYIIKNNKKMRINGSLDGRLPNNINIRFVGINNESLLIALDRVGVAVSAGSACASRALGASHVLIAIGLTERQARESIRITFGKDTTSAEASKAARIVSKIIKNLNIKH